MTTKEFYSLKEIAAKAAKMGHNENEAKGIIKKNYDYLKRTYREASLRELVHIAYVIY
jgi:hypothetical protein